MKNVIIITKSKPLVKINAEPQKTLSISAKSSKNVLILHHPKTT